MRSSRTGATSTPGTAARSRLRRVGRTALWRRSALRVERARTTGCSSGTTATSSFALPCFRAEAGGPVRADVEGEFGDELGDVEADLQVAGGHVAVAGVEQHGLVIAGEQDPVRGQRPVGHLAGVQPGDRVPDLPELLVAAPGVAPGQRGPVVVLVGEHGGLGADPDQRAQPRRGHVGVFRRVGQQRPALDHPVHRHRGAARHRPEQPHRAIDPVEQPCRLLVPVEHHDVQGAVRGGHRVVTGSGRPGAVEPDPPDRADRQVRGSERGGDGQGAGPLRGGAREVPDRQADRAARDHRDQQGQQRRVQHSDVHDGVHADRHPQRVPPGRPPDEADHGGVGDQAGQGGVQGGDMAGHRARARAGHGDRVVEPASGLPAEQLVDDRRHRGG